VRGGNFLPAPPARCPSWNQSGSKRIDDPDQFTSPQAAELSG
jgi:hypothetical protein